MSRFRRAHPQRRRAEKAKRRRARKLTMTAEQRQRLNDRHEARVDRGTQALAALVQRHDQVLENGRRRAAGKKPKRLPAVVTS